MKGRVVWALASAVLVTGVSGRAEAQDMVATKTPSTHAEMRSAEMRAAERILARRISVTITRATVREAIDAVARSAKTPVSYRSDIVAAYTGPVTVRAKDQPLGEVLAEVLMGTPLGIRLLPEGGLAITENSAAAQRKGAIAGVVTDAATQRPVADAIVTLDGTTVSVRSDKDGAYRVSGVAAGSYVLVVRRLGYLVFRKTVSVTDNATAAVNVALTSAPSSLEDVVTTATGAKRRVEVANEVTRLDVDEIRKTAPINNLTDLLVGRVPGLTTIRSSGAPGDPIRIRLRGVGSLMQNNDPIVVVDGIRMYAAQSDPRNANSTLSVTANAVYNQKEIVAAPSPLEQIDPNSIATIEVLNGPSATAIYGSEAAAGVIVITTKRGVAGQTHWSFEGYTGTSHLRTNYPDRYLRIGRNIQDNTVQQCRIIDFTCTPDTMLVFNASTQGGMSPIGDGRTNGASVLFSGGTNTLRYSVSGTRRGELGLIELPQRAADQFIRAQGEAPPGWMRRPERYSTTGGSLRLNWTLPYNLELAYSGALSQGRQNKSSLANSVVEDVSRTYADPRYDEYYFLTSNLFGSGVFRPSSTYLSDFYRQSWDDQQNTQHGANVNWMPRPWLSVVGDAGIAMLTKEDHGLLRRGYITDLSMGADTGGYSTIVTNRTTMTTVNLRSSVRPGSWLGITVVPALGINYVRTTTSDVSVTGSLLAVGSTSITGATNFVGTDQRESKATFGTYLELAFNLWNQFYFSPAIRYDGGSTFGQNVNLFAMPKLGTSWLISDAPFFPKVAFLDGLRIRAAYGQAGTQPQPADRLRLYQPQSVWVDGENYPGMTIASFGNTQLRPERSVDTELGFDVYLFNNRLQTEVTWYHKVTKDQLQVVRIAPSVLGGVNPPTLGGITAMMENSQVNLGKVQNDGIDLNVTMRPISTGTVDWTSRATYSHNQNILKKLNPEASLLNSKEETVRYVEGYPLQGRWSRPMVSYADANGNGVIEMSEVQVADSSVFMGGPLPRYVAGFQNTIALFNGTISVSGLVEYTNGQTQVNDMLRRTAHLSRALNDPTTPLATQAVWAMVAGNPFYVDDYAITQTVSTLRFSSFNLSYRLPQRFTSLVKASMATLSLQGTNLGLRSNYTGLDPNMNVLINEVDGYRDAGGLPQPKMWRLQASIQY